MDNIIEPDESVGDNNHYDAREDPLNMTSPFKEVVLYRLTGEFIILPQTIKYRFSLNRICSINCQIIGKNSRGLSPKLPGVNWATITG